MIPLYRLESSLRHSFAQPALLAQALTHRSFGAPHNERLEFLGDSVLNCVIATLLFESFPGLREGELSRQRANLVKQETLFEIAQTLNLGDFLRLGEGELKSGGFRRPSILADALEALIGAVYLDAGFSEARVVIQQLFLERLLKVDPKATSKDAKTELQEILQSQKLPLPVYTLVKTTGEAHAQEFLIECTVKELNICTSGSAGSRRAAEQIAARQAINLLKQS